MNSFVLIVIAIELFFIWYAQSSKKGLHHLFNFRKDLSRFSDEELEAELAKRRKMERLEDEIDDLKKEIELLKSKDKETELDFEEISREMEELKESEEKREDDASPKAEESA